MNGITSNKKYIKNNRNKITAMNFCISLNINTNA